ncbi:6-phosphofructokinase [Calocera viscosa TUFC12733]|uniref:ATP-dependent 6-phosphofructokinase n=1 Tax=Calocera viscosa (strain TUFC12733) TaxID=1330018 RepID=A0A167HEZ5_CALVF|nr:6-phosphofructokinase [Calocera viscosa TUFC12733]
MRIAVLTSGGDSAGMNPAVRAVVKAGITKGCETYVIREGYEGLVRGNTTPPRPRPKAERHVPAERLARFGTDALVKNLSFGDGPALREGAGDADEEEEGTLRGRHIVRVGWDDVRGWMGEGGTFIGSARSASFRTLEGRLAAAHNLIKEGIDGLVVCGGDGSLTGADRLRAEWGELVQQLVAGGKITETEAALNSHLKIVGLVGSIDNDMALTDMTIGAPTALTRICEAIDNINSTAASHSRAFVVEVMGRHCGWLALMAGVSAGADYVFIPEQPPKSQPWEEEMCEVIRRHREVGKRKTIVIVAEGAHDRDLNPIKAEKVKDVLTEVLKLDTRVTTLGHTQRGGRPVAMDRILPTLQGIDAVNALLEATPDQPSYMIGIHENKILRIPLVDAVQQTQAVAAAIEARDFGRAMSLRDPEFEQFYNAFNLTSTLEKGNRLPKEKRLRVAILHMGAPAGGMNAATRTAVRYCISKGHKPVCINNGFKGLLDDNVSELSWLKVDNWTARGGSELGTNRHLPDTDLGGVASKFQQHQFDALFMIGGFEAFSALLILEKARKDYPAFNVPMVHLPATISNNVPLTDFSLGCDTSLNAIVDACDAIRQSAAASRNRVFVVETQGGQCGYIAAMGALATGAVICYTPEKGVNLDTLRADVRFLKARFMLDEKGKSEGRLIIRNEKSSDVYSTEVITKILKEEGGDLFDSRSASLGHTLQGGIPSPIDRARAVRLTMMCMEFLETHAHELLQHPPHRRRGTRDTAAVITIQGSGIKFVPVEDLVMHADMKKRRGKHTWWEGIKDLSELLGGRTDLVAHKFDINAPHGHEPYQDAYP